jgi:hypothetical protein
VIGTLSTLPKAYRRPALIRALPFSYLCPVEREIERCRDLSLAYSQHDPPLSHTRCDMQIDRPKSFAAPRLAARQMSRSGIMPVHSARQRSLRSNLCFVPVASALETYHTGHSGRRFRMSIFVATVRNHPFRVRLHDPRCRFCVGTISGRSMA